MSETDSFIDEVTEEVRRDRLFALMRKYGWIGVSLIVLIVAGSGVVEYRRAKAEAQAQAFGDQVLAAVAAEKRAEALAAISADAGGRAALRDLLAAADLVEAGDLAAADAKLSAISTEGLPAALGDLIAFKRALISSDKALKQAEFTRLSAAGAGLRPLALEALALMALEAGDTKAATAQLKAILQEPELSQGLKRRVGEVLVTLGESAE